MSDYIGETILRGLIDRCCSDLNLSIDEFGVSSGNIYAGYSGLSDYAEVIFRTEQLFWYSGSTLFCMIQGRWKQIDLNNPESISNMIEHVRSIC